MGRLEQRLEEAVRAWNAGDLDRYLTLYDPTVRMHGVGPEPLDKEGVARFYRSVWAALPAEGRRSPNLLIHPVALEQGSRLACRFVMSGVHGGSFMGIPATGRPYQLQGITILRFNEGDRVVERHSCADMLGLLVQIGAVPPPG